MFVAGAGSNQTASVRTTATAFSFNASSGDLAVGGNVTAYSDERLKTDIETLKNALELIENIRGVSFLRDGRKGLGVVAQELEKVLPELVNNNEDGYKSVAYANLSAVFIEAIKELNKEIALLKTNMVEQQTQIDVLKAEVAELKSK